MLFRSDRAKTGLKQPVEARSVPKVDEAASAHMPSPDTAAQINDLASDFMRPEVARAALGALVGGAGGACPVHGVAWATRPAGVSKVSGKEYAAFYTCSAKLESGFCKERPSREWVKANPIRGGAPAQAVPESTNNLEDLPF